MALTITFALCAALLLSLTVVPALAATSAEAGRRHPRDPWLVRVLHAGYDPFLGWAMRNPLKVGATAVAGLVVAGLLFTRIGSTFMPAMDEGTPVVTLRKHPTISVDAAAATDILIQRQIMAAVPEVRGIMGRAGADELGIDPVGLNDTDLFLEIEPRAEWRDRRTGTSWWPRCARCWTHPGHLLRHQPADRHAGAGDDHRRPRRRGHQGVRLCIAELNRMPARSRRVRASPARPTSSP